MFIGAKDYERLPFRPGESPFHIKGVAYLGHVDYVGSNIPGGLEGSLRDFHDPALREFFAQRFFATNWYDVFPLVAAGYACAHLKGLTLPDFLRARTRWQAERDVNGVYKLLLKLASAEAVAMRLPRLVATYCDFGKTEARVDQPNVVEGSMTGVPEPLYAWYSTIAQTYTEYALGVANAKNPRARLGAKQVDGRHHGLDTCVLRMTITWA
jgi:hypothetical protein